MSFKNPLAFILLIPVLIATFYYIKNDSLRFFKTNFPLNIPPVYSIKLFLIENLPFYSRFLIIMLLILALARPQKILKTEIPPTEGIDIMLVIDTSLSMLANDLHPNRLEVAKLTAKSFIDKRKNDRIGLTVFGGVAFLSCPLTLDHQAVKGFIDRIVGGMTKSDGTAVGDAILVATNHLKKSKAKSKIMILLTDGRSNTGIIQDPITAAKITKEFKIKIYTIGTATKGPAQIYTGNPLQPYLTIEDDLNENELKQIANITGGRFYRATSAEELQRIYEEIDKLEKTKFEIKHHTEVEELYNRFLLPAIFLTIFIIIIEKTYLLTVP